MVPIQKVVQVYKSNLNLNNNNTPTYQSSSAPSANQQKKDWLEAKKKFDSILAQAMKKN